MSNVIRETAAMTVLSFGNRLVAFPHHAAVRAIFGRGFFLPYHPSSAWFADQDCKLPRMVQSFGVLLACEVVPN
ncbi:MAG: hypothetical protein AB7U20_22895 [Planctomycetaceae bacterium]